MQTVKIDNHGNKFWLLDNKHHRLDGPAAECANGDKQWWAFGKRHRFDSPAIENANGDKFWYQNNLLHRVGGPAQEYNSGERKGERCWFFNGVRHCENGPAVTWSNGDKFWYLYGKRHRRFGPAAITAKGKEWWLNGKRYDVSSLDKKSKFWWLNSNQYEKNRFTPFLNFVLRVIYMMYYFAACFLVRTDKSVAEKANASVKVDPVERDRKYAVVRYPLSNDTIDMLANGYWERKRNRKA